MAECRAQRLAEMEGVAAGVPSFCGRVGLPALSAEALSVSEFHLQLGHVNLPRGELAVADRSEVHAKDPAQVAGEGV